MMTALAFADTIEGDWRTQSGETAGIAKCGGSFCIKLKTGEHSGKTIGRMKGSAGNYSGTITDPEDDRVYSGSARVNGGAMRMRGCALKIFCKTQTWRRM